MAINSNYKEKITEIFSSKTFAVCAILTLVYLLSGYWKWFEILTTVIAAVSFIILPTQDAFCIYLYSHNFTMSNISYESCLVATTICFCLTMLVKYIIGAKKGKYPVYLSLVIALTTFVALTTLISLPRSFHYNSWVYIFYFILFYLIFAMRKDFKIHQIMNYLTVGMLVSCSLSLLSLTFPAYQYNPLNEDLNRFMAFTNHPNSIYIRALFVLTYYMYLFLNKKLSNLSFVSIYSICTIILLSTLSKMGLMSLALYTLIGIIIYLKQDFKKHIKPVMIFMAILLLILLICNNYILMLLGRFASSEETTTTTTTLDSATTGRADIWADYLKACFASPFTALFGNGLLTEEVFIVAQGTRRASHSLYIFFLYRFGIVGTLAFGYILYMFIKILSKDKPKFIASLPMIMILIASLASNTFKSYNFTYFILASMIMFSESKVKNITNEPQPSENQSN